MSIILRAKNVHKSYRMGKESLHVLRGVNVEIERGTFAAIVGASGSGKSTLLHILGALDTPDKGTVEFNGRNLNDFSARQLNEYRNRSVGFVFQFYHLLDELNVLENTLLPAMASNGSLSWLHRKQAYRRRAEELLAQMGLSGRLKHRPFELSGGERQRVAIARSLMNQPVLLLADEPTGNLDSQTGFGILEVLSNLNRQGQTIVMVTHDDRIAVKAGRILRLTDGKMESARNG